jgi:hypothetical protein
MGGATSGGSMSGGSSGGVGCSGSSAFDYTGAAQTFVVPACATRVTIEAFGAEGGAAYNRSGTNPVGGRGGRVLASVAVTGNETLRVYVGGRGEDGTATDSGFGGWNGGGSGGYAMGSDWTGAAGGGGGATDVRRGGTTLANRIVVAGGGGGAGGACTSGTRPAGGQGGGLIGGIGGICLSSPESQGGGGTQTEGGVGGDYTSCVSDPGDLGIGGNSCPDAGGGGGGGYYGGGAGAWGGGGGGSNFTISGASGVAHTAGNRVGNGRVVISW